MEKFILIVPSNSDGKYCINQNYIKKIKKGNILYYICDYNINNIKYENMAGILLSGGGDIHPDFYKKKVNIKTNSVDKVRDMFEIEIVQKAYLKNIPIFGICKGAQIINVAFGGDILQHIDGHIQQEDRHIPTHFVKIRPNSILYDTIKKEKIKVNSIHHQCIGNVAKNLKITATSGTVVEAIEYKNKDKFVLGVQWHPEALDDINSDKIFEKFINSAKKLDKRRKL